MLEPCCAQVLGVFTSFEPFLFLFYFTLPDACKRVARLVGACALCCIRDAGLKLESSQTRGSNRAVLQPGIPDAELVS